ncbi:MAG TPA: TetR/AcrR family transcriptional regulator [Iamia sp.]
MSPAATRGVERALAPHRERYEAEVELLVRAAFAVIRRTGSASPTVAEILAEAGLSTTAFYRHFPTKDDLLVTLLERAHERTGQHIARAVETAPDPAARVDAWITALFDMVATRRDVRANRPFLLAHPRLLERYPDEIGAGIDRLVAGLAELLEAAGAEGIDPAVTARLTYHLVFGYLVDRAALDAPVDPATVAAVCAHTRAAASI